MSISVDLRSLDPLHYVTPERVAALREVVQLAEENSEKWKAHTGSELAALFRDAEVLLMALETLVAERAPTKSP